MTFHLYCILTCMIMREHVSADSQDQDTASQKSQSEKEDPPDSPPHVEPKDDEDICDVSQQRSILSDDQINIMDKDGE